MSGKKRINLIMAMSLVIMLAMTYFSEHHEPEAPVKTLLDQDTSQTGSVVIERLSERISFRREGEQWLLTEPLQAPVNPYRIRQFLAIAHSRIDEGYPLAEDMSVFGFSASSPKLYIDNDVLVFGSSHPLDGRRYVTHKNRLFLIALEDFGIFNSQATDFIEKKLLPADAVISRIETPAWKLVRNSEGHWATSPENWLNPEKQSRVLNAWKSARAIDIRQSAQTSISDAQEIAVSLENGAILHFSIIARKPSLLLERRDMGLQFEMTEETAKALLDPDDAGTS